MEVRREILHERIMGKMMTAAVLPAVSVALIGCSRRQDVAATTDERDDVAIFSEAAEDDTMPDGLIRSALRGILPGRGTISFFILPNTAVLSAI